MYAELEVGPLNFQAKLRSLRRLGGVNTQRGAVKACCTDSYQEPKKINRHIRTMAKLP